MLHIRAVWLLDDSGDITRSGETCRVVEECDNVESVPLHEYKNFSHIEHEERGLAYGFGLWPDHENYTAVVSHIDFRVFPTVQEAAHEMVRILVAVGA